jgi:predicted porin
MNPKAKFLLGIGTAALIVAVVAPPQARADDVSDTILKRLDALEKENGKLRAEIKRIEAKTTQKAEPKKSPPQAWPADAVPIAEADAEHGAMVPTGTMVPTSGQGYIVTAPSESSGWYFKKKPGNDLTFLTPGGSIQFYGNLDVSFDVTTKGIAGKLGNGGDPPVGNMGWMPAMSTNLSYVGIRGDQKLYDGLKFVYQLETQIDITASSGVAETNSNLSNVVKGGLTSRNSYIGLASADWGAIKFGKTDAPYKLSTASMNPFSGMIGDYQVIMSNSGGDNRVEFGTRLDHSMWWESPNWGGLRLAALYSPGQNRASNSDNIAAGESDCTGGNVPGSGGLVPPVSPIACNDGSFSDAVSVSISYAHSGFLVTAAYERHFKVNRSSDIDLTGPNAALAPLDVADEDAAKVGVQYTFPTKTTVSGIYESMHRYVDKSLSFQNERTRNGTWLAVTQELTSQDNISFGWAHAFATPGDPGQHNTPGGPNPDNAADMYTVAYKHTIKPGLLWYVTYAATLNHPDAHFDLGAGGRGVTTDCHDAGDPASGGESSSPHCFAGGHLQGVSVGMKYTW